VVRCADPKVANYFPLGGLIFLTACSFFLTPWSWGFSVAGMAQLELLISPIEVECRHCYAKVGESCTTEPATGGQWVRCLKVFHSVRWRDFNKARGEQQAMNDWDLRYGTPKAGF
jgi:hypothetical protein